MSENTYPASLVRWLIFAAVLAADVMDLLSTTVTNVATPTILHQLHAAEWLAPWLGASYSLALGSGLVLGARLGDRFGARRVFLVGLCGFAVASALCGLAPSVVAIVVFRILQGSFGALLIPQGFTLLLRVFPRSELGRVFALFGPLMAVSSISGPVIAGLLISADPLGIGWRAIFLLNLVVGALLLVVAIRVLPRLDADPGVKLDPVAAVLLSVGVLGVLGSLTQMQAPGPGWIPAALGSVGVVTLVAFVIEQRRSPKPLLAPSLFRNRGFVAGAVVGICFFAVTAGLLFATTLYLQLGRGLPVLPAAAIVAATSAGIIASSFSTRALIPRFGRRLLLCGLLVLAVGTAAYLAVVLAWPDAVALLAIPLFVCGVGMGCGFGTVFAVALGGVEDSEASSASGTLNGAQQIANAIGAAVISSTYLTVSSSDGPELALVVGLAIVLGCVLLSLLTLPLLPKRAADTH